SRSSPRCWPGPGRTPLTMWRLERKKRTASGPRAEISTGATSSRARKLRSCLSALLRERLFGSGDVAVGGRFAVGSESEQGLEAGQRGAAAVVTKDEFVEVDLEVLG